MTAGLDSLRSPLLKALGVIRDCLMKFEEYAQQKLERSAEKAKLFWDGVKNRFSKNLLGSDDQLQVIDIQEISDDCVDMILLRKNKNLDIDQLEHCRIIAENRWFKKPKITMHFSSGPFSHDFFDEK